MGFENSNSLWSWCDMEEPRLYIPSQLKKQAISLTVNKLMWYGCKKNGVKTWAHAEDPVLQSREKVQRAPSLCLCGTVHSRDEPSEPVEAPGPGCDSGRDGGTGSTTMSKSDTFQGPGGFRTPSAPGELPTPPPPPPTHQPHSDTETSQRQDSTDTWEEEDREREGFTVYTTQEREWG